MKCPSFAAGKSVPNPVYAFSSRTSGSYPKTWSVESLELVCLLTADQSFTALGTQEMSNRLLRRAIAEKLKAAATGAATIGIIACGVAAAVASGGAAVGGASCMAVGGVTVGRELLTTMLKGMATTLGKDIAVRAVAAKGSSAAELVERRVEALEVQRELDQGRIAKLVDALEKRIGAFENHDSIARQEGDELARATGGDDPHTDSPGAALKE